MSWFGRLGRPAPGTAGRPVECAAVQESISSRLDGEPAPLTTAATDAHLAACPTCRWYAAGAVALAPEVHLRSSIPIPAGLSVRLATEVENDSRHRRRFALGPVLGALGPGRRRWMQWLGAVTPGVAVAIALPLGVISHPHLDPSMTPTPCTAHLIHHRAAPR